jgi:hypothetical protein
MQPIVSTENRGPIFQRNAVVDLLLEEATKRGFSLNNIVQGDYPPGDLEQFYQLIGYSLGGYSELSLVSDEAVQAAYAAAEQMELGAEGGGRE